MVRAAGFWTADLEAIALALEGRPDEVDADARKALKRIRSDLIELLADPPAAPDLVGDDTAGELWIEADDGAAFNLNRVIGLLLMPAEGVAPMQNPITHALLATFNGAAPARIAVGQEGDLRELRAAILARLEAGGAAVLRISSLMAEAFARGAAKPPLDHPDGGTRSD